MDVRVITVLSVDPRGHSRCWACTTEQRGRGGHEAAGRGGARTGVWLAVYAWHDADGDGVLCLPDGGEELSGLVAVEEFPSHEVVVEVGSRRWVRGWRGCVREVRG